MRHLISADMLHVHHLKKGGEKQHVISSIVLRRFATGMVNMFIPIYLYELGVSIPIIASYFILFYIFKMSLYPFMKGLIIKRGIHHVFKFSYVTSSLFMICMYLVAENHFFLIPALFLGGATNVMFFGAHHIDLSRLFKSSKMSKDTGKMVVLSLAVGITAPLFGGFIAEAFGPQSGLLISLSILLLATASIQHEMIKEDHHKIDLSEYAKPIKIRPILNDLIANFANNYESYASVFLWPIYLFLIGVSYSEIGAIVAINGVIAALLAYYVGKQINPRFYLKIGSIVRAFSFMLRPLAQTIRAAFMIDLIGAVGIGLKSGPFFSYYYNDAKKTSIIPFVLMMEFSGDIAKIALWSLLGIITLATGDPIMAIRTVFISVIPVSLAVMLIGRIPHNQKR